MEGPPDVSLDLESFSGSIPERILVGADSSKSGSNNASISSARLRWKHYHCSIDNLKQQLKEAGRLDHMIASKSYRYVDSQQASLVVGSHGSSILETAICVNRSLRPASTLIKVRGCRDEDRWLQGIESRKWRHSWDISKFHGRHEHFWMDSQRRLRSDRSLNQWSLLLEMDKVKRLPLRELVGMRPSEQLGHWEYTDEEADSIKYRPISVHVRS